MEPHEKKGQDGRLLGCGTRPSDWPSIGVTPKVNNEKCAKTK
jgi:hypothetical protein